MNRQSQRDWQGFSLSPSEGERAGLPSKGLAAEGVRGPFVPSKFMVPNAPWKKLEALHEPTSDTSGGETLPLPTPSS